MAARWERPPAAAAVTLLLSLGASAPGLLPGASAGRSAAALRPAALRAGEVHRLVTYIFVYEDLVSLTCGAIVIWYFAGSFEKNVGTVKHCFLTLTFAILSALLYLLLETVVSRVSAVQDAQGFMPVAFATLGVSSTRSRMKRALVLGVRVPVVLVPWLLLCVAWFVPHSSLLSNLCGLLAGEAYGLGYCFCLDFPESVGSKLDQVFPFCLLRRIPGLRYIPGSVAERRAAESSRISPAPGAYPTQSYSCAPPPAPPAFHTQHPGAQSQGLQHGCGQEGALHGPAAGRSPASSPRRDRGVFGGGRAPAHAAAAPGPCRQPGQFSSLQHTCPAALQTPAAPGSLPGVQQAPGYPAPPAAPAAAGSLRVQLC